MEFVEWFVGMWCLVWWVWAVVEIATLQPWMDEGIKKKVAHLPQWVRVTIFIVVGYLYILIAPINKPYMWFRKEHTKKRISTSVQNIKDVLKDAKVPPEHQAHVDGQLDELETFMHRAKDKDW